VVVVVVVVVGAKKMKRKLTLSVDENIIELAKMDELNISNVVEEYLRNYLETNSTEAIDNKIVKLTEHINALNQRKTQLLILGASETKNQGLQEKVWAELRQYFKLRQDQGLTDTRSDIDWINTPKNIQRCKILEKNPLEVIVELRDLFSSHKI